MNQIPENNNLENLPAPKLTSSEEKLTYGVGCFYELTKWLIVLIILASMVHFFLASISIISGESMEPSLHDGEIVIVNRWQYLFGTPERGDAVTLKFPGDPEHKKYIKRLVGLPGEKVTIRDNSVYINDNKLNENYLFSNAITEPDMIRQLKADEYFLLGDNRENSNDSRMWGPAAGRYLIGRAMFVVWPPKYWGEVEIKE